MALLPIRLYYAETADRQRLFPAIPCHRCLAGHALYTDWVLLSHSGIALIAMISPNGSTMRLKFALAIHEENTQQLKLD